MGHSTDADQDITPSQSTTRTLDMGHFSKLVAALVRTRREQGDIWPTLLTKQCVEFYERLDMVHHFI